MSGHLEEMRDRLLLNGAERGDLDLAHQRVRSASVILPPEPPFKDAAREALTARPGVAPESV